MSGDIAIRYSTLTYGFDLPELEQNDLARDDGLETAVIISLFSDRRVTREEAARDDTDLRGWWGDAADPLVDGDLIGSKLWLLNREKSTDETLARAREYCLEALQWLIDEKVAKTIEVETSFVTEGRVSKDLMQIMIRITRPEGDSVNFKYFNEWKAQTNALF